MIRKLSIIILVLINIFLVQGVYCQSTSGIAGYLSHKFNSYTTSVPREELYVHSDREDYISGEDLWFNVYLFDRKNLQLTSESKIAYVEVLNPENRPVAQKKILLNEGVGQGQLFLPDTLSNGNYTLRAYTNWMKNFLPFNCFSKEIKIYNSFSNKILKSKVDYSRIINGNTFNIPENSGLSLNVNNLKSDILELKLSANNEFRTNNNNICYLFIQTHGNINLVSAEGITDAETTINIPKSQLSPGINQITIFDSKGRPVVERYIYTHGNTIPEILLNITDSSRLRSKVSLDVRFKSSGTTSPEFSVSAAPVTNNAGFPDIDDYIIFGSEFGLIPETLFHNGKLSTLDQEKIDDILKTFKSNWINWDNILTDTLPVFKYPVENEDHYLRGRLIGTDQKAVSPNSFVVLSLPGKIPVFQYAKTDAEGGFSFQLHIDDKINDLIIQPDKVDKNQTVNLESSFSELYLKPDRFTDSTFKAMSDNVSLLSINNQVRKLYGVSTVGDPIKRSFAKLDLRRFYGAPEQEIVMKDYITLPVMQEVFFELLVGTFLKNKKTGYEISIADPESNRVYDTPPGLFVDGVMIKDPSLIASIDPENVELIDVVRHKYMVGEYLFYGLVNVITKAADFNNVIQPGNTLRIRYSVLDPVYSFASPDYSSEKMKKRRIPDFRNTLYWNPSVRPDKEGKASCDFWTSDFISDYEINIQGVSSDGRPFSLKKVIKVK